MSNRPAIKHLQIGTHAYPYTATPGTLQFLETVGRDPMVPMISRMTKDDHDTHDGQPLDSYQGTLDPNVGDLTFPLSGLNASADDGAGSTSGISWAFEAMFEALLGRAVVEGEGDLSAASAGTSTVPVAAAGHPFAAGDGLMWREATTNLFCAGEVESVSGDSITMLLELLNREGSGITPKNSATVIGSKSFIVDPDKIDHDHLYFDIETIQGARYIMDGAFGSPKLVFPRGGQAKLVVSGLQITDFTGPSAKASPSYSAPAVGNEIRVLDLALTLEHASVNSGAAFLAHAFDCEVDYGLTFEPRTSGASTWGHRGFVVSSIRPKITGKMRVGTLTGPDELTHADLHTLHDADGGAKAQLQCGRTAQGSVLVTAPSCDVRFGKPSLEGAAEVVPFELVATRSSNEANVPGPLRTHIF